MTISVENGIAMLGGRCGAEDAEQLLVALQEQPDIVVDLSTAARLHTAIVQIILALKPSVRGSPEDPIIRKYVLPGLASE